MMTETTTSGSSSAVESARVEAVTPTPLSLPDESAVLDKVQREAIALMVRQVKDVGIGPDRHRRPIGGVDCVGCRGRRGRGTQRVPGL